MIRGKPAQSESRILHGGEWGQIIGEKLSLITLSWLLVHSHELLRSCFASDIYYAVISDVLKLHGQSALHWEILWMHVL